MGSALEKPRCGWACCTEGMLAYHDREWGVPRLDDRGQFELLVLESAQAGLSWRTVLERREGYRRCFAGFDPQAVARFGPGDVERLLQDRGIVRNRLKIEAAVANARNFLELSARHGSFARWLLGFTDGRIVQNCWTRQEDVPPRTPLSDAIARELKRLGFRFVGSTIVYSHLQATGLVNDHLASCFRHAEVARLASACASGAPA